MFDILGVKIEKIDEELITKFRELALEKLYYTESELALVSDHTLINKFKGNYLIYPLRDDDADRWRFTLIEIETHRELYGAKKIIEIY